MTTWAVDDEDMPGSLWRRTEIRWLVTLTSLGFASFFLTLASLPCVDTPPRELDTKVNM